MGAPTGLTAIDRIQLGLSLLCGPQGSKIVIVVRECAEFLAQLARAHVTVIINHGNRLARRARKRPAGRTFEVCMLSPVVRGDRADVRDIPGKALCPVVISKHAIAIALG